MANSASEMLGATVAKVEDFLEQVTIIITDHMALSNDSTLTVVSHDSLYNLSIVAEWFHSIPHVDIRLRPLPANITFDPNDNEYLESLGILVALPGFWLILTLLFFLIFFLCRCCDGSNGGNGTEQQKQQQQQHTQSFHQQQIMLGKSSKPRRLTGCKLCLALIATITGFAITVGLLGSVIAHRGMMRLRNSTTDIANVLETVQNDTRQAGNELRDQVDHNVESLKSVIETMLVKDVAVKSDLETQLFFLKRIRRVDEIYSRMERLNIRPVPETLTFVERVRWPATFAFALLLAIFLLILLCGLIRHSRCTLIMFSVFGLLALVIGWVLSSFYLGILVAGSDFCAEPDPFLTDRFSTNAELALYDYYVRCPIGSNYGNSPQQQSSAPNPFRRQTRESLAMLEHMFKLIRTLEMLCISYCHSDQGTLPQIDNIIVHLNSTERLLKSVQSLLDCRRIHEDFTNSMTATCKDLVEGVFLMLITSMAIGLLFTMLVLCASHTWIHIRTNCNNTGTSIAANSAISHASSSNLGILDSHPDETDPFLSTTPHHLHSHHHTMLSNNSTSSSLTNTSLNKRFRDSYGSAYGTTVM
ncbi:chloride channel [Blomia tropicalis]|nr:chloride channel [Blomia tropicalis]